MGKLKGYKVRIYPNKEQQKVLEKHIGACRFVYNHFLNIRKKAYLEEKKNLTYYKLSSELTKLRKETQWMQEVRFDCLQQSLRALDVAYNRFFRKQAKFPRFKKKNGKNSMRKVTGWRVEGNKLHIMRGFSVPFRGRFIEKRFGTLTITKDRAGSWWASTMGKDTVTEEKLKGVLGIDVGLKTLAVTSDGDSFENVKVLSGLESRIRSVAQALSRTKADSKRRAKARLRLARLRRKEGFIRENHLHHISKAIVSKNHATIAVENLSVKNMMQNRHLAKSIGDAGWGELVRQITYKQERIGGEVIKIDRFFPSSKTCSVCDFVVDTLPLSVRTWTCGKCHTEHDRDLNAAKMIKKQATFLLGVEGGEGRRKTKITRPLNRGGTN